jgi:hypothetical protein
MPMIEIHLLKPASKVTANNFKSYLFYGAATFYDISIQNETISKNDDAIILYFEISDFDYGDKFIEALEYAYNCITPKHKSNIYTKVFHDSVFEEEFFAKPGKKLMKFDSIEGIELHKKSKLVISKTAVSKYFDTHTVEKYAIVRVRIEQKRNESFLKKVFTEIMNSSSLTDRDNILTSALDKVIESGNAYYLSLFEEGRVWRESMEYRDGMVGHINFLESLVECHIEKKYLTMLLLDPPYDRKLYVPFICGFFGLFGEKTEIKIWSKNPEQTRILWNYEDNIMGPTKNRTFDIDDWTYDNYKSVELEGFDFY